MFCFMFSYVMIELEGSLLTLLTTASQNNGNVVTNFCSVVMEMVKILSHHIICFLISAVSNSSESWCNIEWEF